MNFEVLKNASTWLGRTDELVKIQRIENLLETKNFFVTFWGHYSAGKSKLINNILDREILPVQNRETTAVLTYLMYDEYEKCHVIYDDGKIEVNPISEVKSIFQNMENMYKLENIDHIEVYLNSEVLKGGLIIVDTPGVNTLIQKHQDLAVDAIEQSGKIVYVLGNAPTDVDKNFVRQINDSGIEIVFARTKVDQIKAEEENVEVSLAKEKEELSNFICKDIIFIPVSNEKDSNWNKNIDILIDELKSIGNDLLEELNIAVINKLDVYKSLYRRDISDECERIREAINGNFSKIEKELDLYNQELQSLEKLSAERVDSISRKLKDSKSASRRELDRIVKNSVLNFEDTVRNLSIDNADASDVKKMYENTLTNTIKEIQFVMNEYFDKILQDECAEINRKAESLTAFEETPVYTEIVQDNSRYLEIYNARLLEEKAILESIRAEKQNIDSDIVKFYEDFSEDELNEAIMLLDEQLCEIPSGMAMRLADNQNVQPSHVMKRIGQAADLALLLLPGDVIVKGVKAVADTTKIAQVLHKTGKLGEVIVKTGGAVTKNAKAIDRVRDTVYAANKVLGNRRYSTKRDRERAEFLVDQMAYKAKDAFEQFKENKREGNILDALSIAYWTEKIGAQFDTPPIYELDIVEQRNRDALRLEITDRQKQLSKIRIQKKKELGLLKTAADEFVVAEEEQKLVISRIENELRTQEDYIKRKSRIESFDKLKNDYSEFLNKNLHMVSHFMESNYYATAEQNITLYTELHNSEIISAIQHRKEKIVELKSNLDNNDMDLKGRLLEGENYLNALNGGNG